MIDFVAETCFKCKTQFWMPRALYDSARAARGQISFYCPYGHGQVYCEGETEEQKLRRERDQLAQRIAQKDDTIKYHRERADKAELSARAQRGVVTRLKNRAAAGVCPCCNRTFENLRRHMAAKHPQFQATEATEAASAAERVLQ